MKILKNSKEMQKVALEAKKAGQSVGFVPTMGAFHEGHLSLMRAARKECDQVVVSLFVNPLQFAPQEDLEQYPRNFEKDSEAAKAVGCDFLFYPDERNFYSSSHETFVNVQNLSQGLCGMHRAGHFRGVATVVAKLFHIVNPDIAYFGDKDYQQVRVICQMVEDLNFPIRIVSMPTIRDADGLALSSRNVHLTAEMRQRAQRLPHVLGKAREKFSRGKWTSEEIKKEVRVSLGEEKGLEVEYVEVVHPQNLTVLQEIGAHHPGVLAVAIYVVSLKEKKSKVRLIDHCFLGENKWLKT